MIFEKIKKNLSLTDVRMHIIEGQVNSGHTEALHEISNGTSYCEKSPIKISFNMYHHYQTHHQNEGEKVNVSCIRKLGLN